jgi:hypothetical protein
MNADKGEGIENSKARKHILHLVAAAALQSCASKLVVAAGLE